MHSFQTVSSVVPWVEAHVAEGNRPVLQLLYDSRLVVNGSGGVFFAIQTATSDGHQYIPRLIEKGVSQWVISDPVWAEYLRSQGNQNWLLVANTTATLQQLAAWHRAQFDLPVVGITGSNGKTIVKEWLSHLTGSEFFICKSPKSFNSQLGVPLSVWNLGPAHTLGIFEAGISRPGEMKNLAGIIAPTLGIFTNIGPAHAGGFASETEKLKEKLLLFSRSRYLVVSASCYQSNKEAFDTALPEVEIVPWAYNAEYKQLSFNGKSFPFSFPFSDSASVENLGNALACALLLGVPASRLQEHIGLIGNPEMRLSLKEGQLGMTLVDDTYTNDLAGFAAALQFATQQRKKDQLLAVVLSDMEGLGAGFEAHLASIEAQLKAAKVNVFISVGEQFSKLAFAPEILHYHYTNTAEVLHFFDVGQIKDGVVLLKGGRRFTFETLVKAWQKKVHGTRLETDLDAMVQNLNFYRSQLPPGTGIMAMVKALGYGSGGEEIARVLEYHRVETLAVAYADEGIKLREAGISIPIMVMNPMPEVMESLIRFRLEPEIYSFRTLAAWEETGKSFAPEAIPPIHLKIDTGMHRLGFMPEEIPALLAALKKQKNGMKLSTVFSHLAGSDEDRFAGYSQRQLDRFEEVCRQLQDGLGQIFKKHILNSAGILRYPQATYDLVRLGIGLYGVEVNSWFQNRLQPVSRLRTTISQIKRLKAGETVGYGRSGLLTRDSEIATIAIGYADGFRRDFSQGNAKVKINNTLVPVVGNVCMDMTMIDVTGLACAEGDEVVIFDDATSLLHLAEAAQTIPYEILTGIGQRVRRVFFRS